MDLGSKQLGAGSSRLATRAARPADRHSDLTIALHWGSVALLIIVVASGLARELVEDRPLRNALLELHKQTGLFVLLMLVLRLIVRLRVGMADHSGGMAALQRWAAKLAHGALYVTLALLPLLGWALCSAKAIRLAPLGLFALPPMLADDPDLADQLSDYHVAAAWLLLGLVLAHVAAALWHHFARRDGVLAAMLPLVRRR